MLADGSESPVPVSALHIPSAIGHLVSTIPSNAWYDSLDRRIAAGGRSRSKTSSMALNTDSPSGQPSNFGNTTARTSSDASSFGGDESDTATMNVYPINQISQPVGDGAFMCPGNANDNPHASVYQTPSDHVSDLNTSIDQNQIYYDNLLTALGLDSAHSAQWDASSMEAVYRPVYDSDQQQGVLPPRATPGVAWTGSLNQPSSPPFENSQFLHF